MLYAWPWNRNGGHHADRTECGGKERGYHEEAGMADGRTGHFSDDRHRDSALYLCALDDWHFISRPGDTADGNLRASD